jgi:TonB family protein
MFLVATGWTENPERELKSVLKDKVVLIRGFFQDDRLDYTAEGEVMGTPQPGSWTVAKLQVKSITARQDRLEIRGPRVVTVMDQDRGVFTAVKPSRKRTIKITVHAAPAKLESQELATLIDKILVTDPTPDVSVFPPYWREFLSGHIVKSKDNDGKQIFRRQNEVEPGDRDLPVYTDSARNLVFRVSKNIEGPKLLFQIDPEFSEEARKAKVSGKTIVSMVVDKSGAIQDIQIVQPIGYGLDDQAVRAVEQWRFSPAMRNGEPVAVLINVEVGFRLY